MKINISCYDEKFSWNKNWVFLGISFKNLKLAEKKVSLVKILINLFYKKVIN